MSKTAGSGGATSKLLDALGIDAKSYDCFVAWCLAEELVSELTRVVNEDGAHQTEALWRRADGLKRFQSLVRRYTRRDWSVSDIDHLFQRVQLASEKHFRKPIESGDLLRPLWTKPHLCVVCERRPPEVVLPHPAGEALNTTTFSSCAVSTT